MPEFEDEIVSSSRSQTYTPSTDASKKPRSRRRSGGFKTEVASLSKANIGEVSAAEALKKEKLSGKPSPDVDREPRAARNDKPRRERKPREPRNEGKPREKRAPRTDANPQPSAETLAAIAKVEVKIQERRSEREARRAERDKNRPSKNTGPGGQKPHAARKEQPKQAAPQSSQGGLFAAITGFFGKLFGKEAPTAPQQAHPRDGKKRNDRPQGKGGQRGGQNRRRGGNGGKRGSQNRKRGGQGARPNNRRNNGASE